MIRTDAPFLSHAEIARVGELLYRWTGMVFGESKRYYIERRIGDRMATHGMTTAADYLAFVTANPAERESLINAFTINETYFYREDHQLAALSNAILPELAQQRRPGDLIRIWSVPCSTGEEAYSIAIWLLENWRMVDAYAIEIVASDIDTAALQQAVEGWFGPRALKLLPPELVERYFEPSDGARRKIIDDLRESVRFVPANLVERTTLQALGRFDVVLCRNVLIYFDEAARRAAAENLFASMNPGGYLCLGHCESMHGITDLFTLVRLGDAIVYRRP